jgi:hypothetical protein
MSVYGCKASRTEYGTMVGVPVTRSEFDMLVPSRKGATSNSTSIPSAPHRRRVRALPTAPLAEGDEVLVPWQLSQRC